MQGPQFGPGGCHPRQLPVTYPVIHALKVKDLEPRERR